MRYLRFWLISTLLIFLLTGCANRYMPVGGDGLRILNASYLYQSPEIELVAQNLYWTGEPQNLNDYFTTFHVTVKNHTRDKLKVDASDFALLDQNGNQSDPLSIDQIENILLNSELQYLVVKNIEEWDDKKLVSIQDQSNFLEEWRRAKRNLMRDSFAFGEIFPQAKRTGFIFFPKVNIKNDELTLVYKDQRMIFRR
jgi:hypothetical protein